MKQHYSMADEEREVTKDIIEKKEQVCISENILGHLLFRAIP